MHTARLIYAAGVLGQINQAYRQRALVCKLDVSIDVTWLISLLRRLRALGVIAHYEVCRAAPRSLGQRGVVGLCQRRRRVTVYLHYRQARPAVSVWSLLTAPTTLARISLATLVRMSQASGGLGVILYTPRGWLTPAECIAARCGGVVVFGYAIA